jgi:hypothetical protein
MSDLSLSPGAPDYDIRRIGEPLQVADWAKPKTAYYFYHIKHDSVMVEFCIVNWEGPVRVETDNPDGSHQAWESRQVGDMLVFYAPDGYRMQDGGPCKLTFDKRLMDIKAMPPEEIDKLCLGRISANFGGLRGGNPSSTS